MDYNQEFLEIVTIGSTGAIKEILESPDVYKVDINYRDDFGNAACLLAAQRNDLKMVKLLKRNGANLMVEDGFGRTVLSWADQYSNDEMRDIVLAK